LSFALALAQARGAYFCYWNRKSFQMKGIPRDEREPPIVQGSSSVPLGVVDERFSLKEWLHLLEKGLVLA